MKKRNFLLLALAVLLVVIMSVMFAACHKDDVDPPAPDNKPGNQDNPPVTTECTTHQWGEYTVEKAPTCEEDGSRTHTCTVCGKSENEKLEATGHNWSDYTVEKEPSCTEKGLRTRTCSACDKSENEEMDMVDHTYVSSVTPATCEAAGKTTYVCTVCDHTYEEEGEAQKPHTTTEVVDKEATCEEAGHKTIHCSTCDKDISEEVIPALGHNFTIAKTPVPATCEEDGYTEYECENCHEATEKRDIVKADGTHDFEFNKKVEPDCENEGYDLYICKHCQTEDKRNTVAALGHNYVDKTLAPTCTEMGYNVSECSRCHDEASRVAYCSAAGHQFTTWEDGSSICDHEGCNVKVTATEGLTYEDLADGTCAVTGIGTATATNIVIPGMVNGKVVSAVAANAFKGNTAIVSVTLPASVTTIGESAFEGATALMGINISKNLVTVGKDAFFGCLMNALTVASDNEIYRGEENNCLIVTADKKLIYNGGTVIPASVEVIGTHAMSYNAAITELNIPANVKVIETGAFEGLTQLVKITVAEGNTVYSAAGNCLIDTAAKKLVLGCPTSVIPDDGSVTVIGEAAFAYYASMQTIKIPDAITEIEKDAFIGCEALLTAGLDAATGMVMVDNWIVAYVKGETKLVVLRVSTELRGFANGVLAECTDLEKIDYSEGYSYTWIHNVHRYEGWNNSIQVVCLDGVIENGVYKDTDDTSDDKFE